MPEEENFLKQIAEVPKRDKTQQRETRLVFADWLDERGNPRGELIRIEEECKTLTVDSDEYWKLKPIRNKLRQKSKNEFLSALDYGQVYSPVFSGNWTTWKSRWRLIREWTCRWYQVSLPDVGRVPSDAERLSSILDRELPASLIEWMAFTEDISETPARGLLRDGRTISNLPETDCVSLNIQAEGDVHWAVSYRNLSLEDPPVEGVLSGLRGR